MRSVEVLVKTCSGSYGLKQVNHSPGANLGWKKFSPVNNQITMMTLVCIVEVFFLLTYISQACIHQLYQSFDEFKSNLSKFLLKNLILGNIGY